MWLNPNMQQAPKFDFYYSEDVHFLEAVALWVLFSFSPPITLFCKLRAGKIMHMRRRGRQRLTKDSAARRSAHYAKTI